MAPREGSARLCNRNRGGDRDGTGMKITRAIRRRDRAALKVARERVSNRRFEQTTKFRFAIATLGAIIYTKRNKTPL